MTEKDKTLNTLFTRMMNRGKSPYTLYDVEGAMTPEYVEYLKAKTAEGFGG